MHSLTKHVLSQIESGCDLQHETVVIVPDRDSFLVEKAIFDVLNTNAVFNVNVMGISKLKYSLADSINAKGKNLSTAEGILLMRKVLGKTASRFVCFKDNFSYAFCEEMYKTVMSLKANKIPPENLKEIYEPSLNLKLCDIRLIYEEYEKEIENIFIDQCDALTHIENAIKTSEWVKNSNFLFCQFDSLTKQGFDILLQLCTYARNVVVGILQPNKQSNAYVYEDDLKNKIKEAEKFLGKTFERTYLANALSQQQNFMLENLFSFSPETKPSQHFLTTGVFKNPLEEVIYIAKEIMNQVIYGGRFCQHTLLCCDMDGYASLVESVFGQYNIPVFIDTKTSLASVSFVREILFLLKTQFLEEQPVSSFIHYITNNIEEKRIKETTEEKIALFRAKGELKLEKTIEIALVSLTEILESFHKTIGGCTLSYTEFCDLFECYVKAVKLSVLPVSCDCVFVGDLSSPLGICENLYIAGACEGAFPFYQHDVGLLSDEEIVTIQNEALLSPSIQMLNRRSRLNVLQKLSLAKQSLTVTAALNSEGKTVLPSGVISALSKMFPGSLSLSSAMLEEAITKDFSWLERSVVSKNDLTEKLIFTARHSRELFNQLAQISPALSKTIEKDLDKKNNLENLTETGIFFPDGKLSVSQIISYYNCPFAHFLRYGLRIRKDLEDQLLPLDYGKFLHRFAELFVSAEKNSRKDTCEAIFHTILKEEEFKKFSKQFAWAQTPLLAECKALADEIKRQQELSCYQPTFFEWKFEEKLTVDGKNFTFVGTIDRIDICGNDFNVVDYKSGEIQSGEKYIYHGTELQLLVYASVAEKKLKKRLTGVFYYPISHDFLSSNPSSLKEKKFLKGFLLNDLSVIQKMDKELCAVGKQSSVFNLSLCNNEETRASGNLILKSSGMLVDEDHFAMLKNYAAEAVTNAVREILEGTIQPSPLENECEWCDYHSICGFDEKRGNTKREMLKNKNYIRGEA